ncbi:MAG: hypothetical protein QOE29_1978 [Gaiellaceae bacterium]|nr:hypothetical protein [Gaiellaceae bacterium]
MTAPARAVAAATSAPIPDPARSRAASEQLGALYEAHARRVRLVCLRLLRDAHEADDAHQQAFLSAYRSLLGGGVPQDPEAWLVTIARNECRSRIRDRMLTPLAELEVAELPGRDDPAHEAVQRAELAAVLAAVGELPQREREAVVMQAFGGVSNAEVAARLGTTESAVESLLVRARAQLRTRVWPVAAGARALLFAPPAWLRAALLPGGGSDVVAVTKMGTAVAVVGTFVALGPAIPGGDRGASLGGSAAAGASPAASVSATPDDPSPRVAAPRLGGAVLPLAPHAPPTARTTVVQRVPHPARPERAPAHGADAVSSAAAPAALDGDRGPADQPVEAPESDAAGTDTSAETSDGFGSTPESAGDGPVSEGSGSDDSGSDSPGSDSSGSGGDGSVEARTDSGSGSDSSETDSGDSADSSSDLVPPTELDDPH